MMSPEKGKKDTRCPLSYYAIPSIRTTDSSYVPIDFLLLECLLSAMGSPGLVFFKENRDPLNTHVFSPDTNTGVQIGTSASVPLRLFKCSEPQKEVTPKSLTTSCTNTGSPDEQVDG